jgi:hypothetical protein
MLCASGRQFQDWTRAYRLFAKERFDMTCLFTPIRQAVLQALEPGAPFVALLDDTRLRKRGRKVYGTSWRRDPLGPRFQTNLLWGQRFLQFSAALPEGPLPCRARGIPIEFLHCPTPPKPGKKASEGEQQAWRRAKRESKITTLAAERLKELRAALDEDPSGKERVLVACGDGGYTNTRVVKNRPPRTTFIGRIRKDAKLHALPPDPPAGGRGRRRLYGAPMPTPEQIRQDPEIPWIQVQAWAAGKTHGFDIKVVRDLRWRGAGTSNLVLVVVRPLGYRLAKGSRVLYRQPAYLICTDPNMPLTQLLQAYLWRWEVEVNFRDEKTVLGAGEAQVRTPQAVWRVPALIVAAYSYLMLATRDCYKESAGSPLPRPKWQKPVSGQRITIHQMQGLLRSALWGKGLGLTDLPGFQGQGKNSADTPNFPGQELGLASLPGFMKRTAVDTKSEIFTNSLPSAVIYAYQ